MMPVLAVGAGGGPFTLHMVSQVTTNEVTSTQLNGVGHYAAMEAPDQLSTTIRRFVDSVDTSVTVS